MCRASRTRNANSIRRGVAPCRCTSETRCFRLMRSQLAPGEGWARRFKPPRFLFFQPCLLGRTASKPCNPRFPMEGCCRVAEKASWRAMDQDEATVGLHAHATRRPGRRGFWPGAASGRRRLLLKSIVSTFGLGLGRAPRGWSPCMTDVPSPQNQASVSVLRMYNVHIGSLFLSVDMSDGNALGVSQRQSSSSVSSPDRMRQRHEA